MLNNLDWYFNGTLSEKRLLPRQWWFPFVLLLFILLFGPASPPPGYAISSFLLALIANLATSVAAIWLLGFCLDWLIHQAPKGPQSLFWIQFGVVGCGMAFFLFALADGHLDEANPTWREQTALPVPHLFAHLWLPLAFLAFGVAALARPIARLMLGDLPDRIRAHKNFAKRAVYLANLEEKKEPTTSLLRSIFDVLSSPVEILYPPALFIVMVDSRVFSQYAGTTAGKWIYYVFAGFLGFLAIVVLVRAEHSNLMAALRTNLRRIFWFGGSFLTTVFVIVLAGLWIWDVTYVKSVMEGSRLTVIFLVLASYAVFWTYEFWVNHVYGEELLGILGDVHAKLYVELDHFRVCIHGAAKLSLVEQLGPNAAVTPIRIFDRSEFFQELFKKLDEDEADPDAKVAPSWTPELSGKGKMYFVTLNALIFVPVMALALCLYKEWHPARIAIVTADLTAQPGPDQLQDMEKLLFEGTEKTPGKRPRVILVAASGGGTRAALYTSSALDGLRLKGNIQNVKAVSGVSGGGVALAYFGAHHARLSAGDQAAWERFHEAMAYRYFIDVLRGTPEFRIPWHSSISALLPESFERQFYRDRDERAFQTLGQCPIGLIFNTTLAGESPPPFGLKGGFKPSDDDIRHSAYGSGLYAGSRLILTNFTHPDAFPAALNDERYPWNEVLRYVVVNDPKVRLVRAASLNANFPPVFPNAPVDVTDKDGKHRFWVTDGGAEENRGQVSLMYGVRGAIKRRLDRKGKTVLPDIHLVVVEASGGSAEYKQDFGLSAAENAAQKLANQLALELENDIQRLYGELHAKQPNDPQIKDRPTFKTHYLPMPSAFRIDGGVGTHWMMPELAKLGQPTVRAVLADPDIYLDRETLKVLLRKLHRPEMETDTDAITQTVNSWRKDDPLPRTHKKAWDELCADLER